MTIFARQLPWDTQLTIVEDKPGKVCVAAADNSGPLSDASSSGIPKCLTSDQPFGVIPSPFVLVQVSEESLQLIRFLKQRSDAVAERTEHNSQ